MQHVCCNCVCIRQVLEFRDIEKGLSMHGALFANEAVVSNRVAPSRRRLSKLPRASKAPAPVGASTACYAQHAYMPQAMRGRNKIQIDLG